MNWKQYQNELIVLATFVLMLLTYMYKSNQASTQIAQAQTVKHSLEEIKEVIDLRKVWADKKISKKVNKLKTIVPASKLKWSKKGKKVTATYAGLSSNELNKLISKILNMPVEIRLLDIKKQGSTYNVEFKCKW